METSLHHELKTIYGGAGARFEVRLDGFRIDAVRGRELIEIQHGSLAAIRDKIARLLERHRVLVVKPIIVRRHLVRRSAAGGPVIARRLSPKQGSILDLFDELIYFTRVFPHKRLALELPLVEVEEWRYPGHGRRRRWRMRDHIVEDQKLIAVEDVFRFETADDVAAIVTCPVPRPFDTAELAAALGVRRWTAQRIVYCLRKIGGLDERGKRGNARLYDFSSSAAVCRRPATGRHRLSKRSA